MIESILSNDIWRTTNFWGLGILVLYLSWQVRNACGYILSLTWGYFLCRALFIFENTKSDFAGMGMQMTNPDGKIVVTALSTFLDQTSGQAFAQLLLIPLAITSIQSQIFKHWRKVFIGFGLINSALLFTYGYGFMNASSFDAGMLAVLIPLSPWWASLIYILAIASAGHVATALLICFVMSTTFALHYESTRKQRLLAGAFLGPLVLAAIFAPSAHGFDSSGRIEAWKQFFQWWADNAQIVLGTGTGTFQWLGPYIKGFNGEIFLQMHNDWLQVLFEGGVIGLLLVIMSYGYLLMKSFYRRDLFVTMIGLGVFALTYHPLRFFPSALFIVCALREILDYD